MKEDHCPHCGRPEIPPIVNLGQLALILHLDRKWLKIEAEANRIPSLRVGRKFRFNVDAVEQALAKQATRKT